MATVVLLPGMDGTGTLFLPFLEAVGSDLTTKVISYPSSQPCGYSELQDLINRELPADGTLVILGESFSGPIAISIAAAHPTRVKGLILCCSFSRTPRPFFSRIKFLMGALPIWLVPDSILSRLLLGSFASDDLRSTLGRVLARVSPSTLRARLLAVLSVDVSSHLSQVKVPVLYLSAANDLLVPPRASSLIRQLCPQTEVVSFNAPHLLLQTIPAEAGKVVTAFVQKIDNSP